MTASLRQKHVRDLILVRHGESGGNLDGSGSDTPLTARGRKQAKDLAARFDGMTFALVATSPLIRAKETARLALPRTDLVVDARLSEFAPAPDVAYVDVSALTPEQLTALLAAPPKNARFETGRDFMARVRSWVDRIPATGTTIAFTHYAVIREILGTLLGLQDVPTAIAYASPYHFRFVDGEAQLLATNDTGQSDR